MNERWDEIMATRERRAVEAARNLEREQLAAKLEAELYAKPEEGATERDRGYREGWNARARSLIAELRRRPT